MASQSKTPLTKQKWLPVIQLLCFPGTEYGKILITSGTEYAKKIKERRWVLAGTNLGESWVGVLCRLESTKKTLDEFIEIRLKAVQRVRLLGFLRKEYTRDDSKRFYMIARWKELSDVSVSDDEWNDEQLQGLIKNIKGLLEEIKEMRNKLYGRRVRRAAFNDLYEATVERIRPVTKENIHEWLYDVVFLLECCLQEFAIAKKYLVEHGRIVDQHDDFIMNMFLEQTGVFEKLVMVADVLERDKKFIQALMDIRQDEKDQKLLLAPPRPRSLEPSEEKIPHIEIGDVLLDRSDPAWAKLEVVDPPIVVRAQEFLASKVRGQERAVRSVARCLINLEDTVFNREHPAGRFLFLGPSRVGKTETAKRLAQFLFGSRNALTRIDCSGYSEEYAISDLVGAPSGYVGSKSHVEGAVEPILSQWNIDKHDFFASPRGERVRELKERLSEIKERLRKVGKEIRELIRIRNEGDFSKEQTDRWNSLAVQNTELKDQYEKLKEKVNEFYRPEDGYRSIILFDEIERASPKLHNLLLGIFDEGKLDLRSGWGQTRFANSIVILTSNIGWDEIKKKLTGQQIGLHTSTSRENLAEDQIQRMNDGIRDIAMTELKRIFPVMILNRLDSTEVFRMLDRKMFEEILGVLLEEMSIEIAKAVPIVVQLTDSARSWLVKESSEKPEEGASELIHKFERHVKDPLKTFIILNRVSGGDFVYVDTNTNGDGLEFFHRHTTSS